MRNFIKSLLFVAFFTLSACGNNVERQIQQSVQENQQAKNFSEWESSAHNPEVLFKEWRENSNKSAREKNRISQEVCTKLKTLDGRGLSIFEIEINQASNRELLADCRKELLDRLNRYFANERSHLDVQVDSAKGMHSTNNFHFNENIKKRDYSKGYFAVTGDLAFKEVALSFDDGPSPQYTEVILQYLKEVNAKAHFFELGKAVRVHPELTRLVAADGHMVGSHTMTHSCIGNLKECGRANGGLQYSFENAVAEIKGGHQAINDVLGWVDPIFRFPYGAATVPLRQFLDDNSIGDFYWSIDSEDWKAQSNQHLIENCLSLLESRGRGIILFHDIQRRTAEILPQFLKELYNRGYSIVLLEPLDSNAKYNSKLVKRNLP